MKKKILAFILCICMVFSCFSVNSFVHAEGEKSELYIYTNKDEGEYPYYASKVVCSYLSNLTDGYQRVSVSPDLVTNSSPVYVDTYGSDYSFKSSLKIDAELPLFGGYYSGADYNFLVWGQENPSESDSTEVIRIVKYDKNWNRLGSASLWGCNTYLPFSSGSLRMVECGDYLFIRTCHLMYDSGDGKHHQASVSIQVRKSDMNITSSFYGVSSGGFYCSHSFNQFIIVDDSNNLVTLDHGDAYPRSAVLVKSGQNASVSENAFSSSSTENTMTYYGAIGENYTQATLGGLSFSSSNYLTVGASVDQSSSTSGKKAENVYVSVTGRGNVGSQATAIKWLSGYTEDGSYYAADTKLVKLGSDRFLVIWSEKPISSSSVENYQDTIKYVFVDGSGNTTSAVYSAKGNLSDCQPIVSGGKAVWYVADKAILKFCSIDSAGKYVEKTASYPADADIYPKDISDSLLVVTKIGDIPYNERESNYIIMYGNKVLTKDVDYKTYGSGCSYNWDGSMTSLYLTLYGIGDYFGEVTKQTNAIMSQPSLYSRNDSDSSIELSWNNNQGVLGYIIEKKVNSGSYKKVADVPREADSASILYWTDKDVKKGNVYTYRMKIYTTNGTDLIYGDYSSELKIDKTVQPTTEKATSNKNSTSTKNTSTKSVIGTTFTNNKRKFKVITSSTVAYIKPTSKKIKTASVPATVKYNGKTYKVTKIAAGAFKNCKKLKKLTIGKNVKTIGSKAMMNCKKLKTITIKSKKLKSIGSKAVSGMYKKAVIKVPNSKKKAYKKLFKAKTGYKKTMKIK